MINQLLRLYGRWLPIALTSTCLAVVAATAQNTPPPAHAKKRSIETHIGYQNQQFKETQQSSIFRQANGISINVAYTTVNGERNQTIGLYYSQTKTDKNFASFANNKFGGIFYNHVRAIHKNIHVGGFMQMQAYFIPIGMPRALPHCGANQELIFRMRPGLLLVYLRVLITI
ncbi:MAG: hypothetical protein ACOVOF_03995 [Chryseotalea sp.]|jgi:hypothetical protein